MSIVPVNIARVSQNLRAFNLLSTVKSSQLELFRAQTQMATGRRFQLPSEDPSGAAAVSLVDRHLDRLHQVEGNLFEANGTLRATEDAMDEAIDLMREAKQIAVESASDTLSAEERHSLATVVDSIIDRLVSIGNREHLGTFLFSGHDSDTAPFSWESSGVTFNGDEGRREIIADTDYSLEAFTISGHDFLGAISTPIAGAVDLDPLVTRDTRISDLRMNSGSAPDMGRVLVSNGAAQSIIDLSAAATVGDVLDKLNAEMPAGLVAEIQNNSLRITGAPQITVTESGGGATARTLGLTTAAPAPEIIGHDLNPVVTPRSRITDLAGGAGLDLSDPIVVHNGDRSAKIDLSGAETIEDVLNILNSADVGVWARISADGHHLDMLNRVSGTDLRVEEAGGTTATALGIRTVSTSTALEDLNLGRGFYTVEGDDIRMTTTDGTVLTFDLDGAETLQDVLDIFNAAPEITAALGTSGNGIVITDNTGAGPLVAEAINESPALSALGLPGTTAGNQLMGEDVHPVRVESAFTSLLELREGLLTDDTRALTFAGERLERVLEHMGDVRGQMAALAKSLDDRVSRIENEETAAVVLRSDLADADLTDTVVRYQQVQTALQANLTVGSQVMNLSLLDYLR